MNFTPTELKRLMLLAPRMTLAVAESLTAGHVQARVASVAGASDFFLGGVTAYTLDGKVSLLGVNRAAAGLVNCVSSSVAEQMAIGAGAMFGSDFAVATTGYAEPAVEWAVTEPFAWWALARKREEGKYALRSGRVVCAGASRVEAQKIVAETALAELVGWLREVRG